MRYILFLSLLFVQGLEAKDFNILDFGAIADGTTLNTLAIQTAIDSAHAFGEGRVIVPKGRFLFGSIDMKSNVELHLMEGAILLGSPIFEHYRKAPDFYQRGFILANHQNNISITGRGVIDGQGREAALYVDSLYKTGVLTKAYNKIEDRPRFYMRPMIIVFVSCTNVKVEDVTLMDAASWVQHYDRCRNVLIKGITVESDAYWNNDGIDISDCKNVLVTDCYINASDDGICLKSHFVDDHVDSVYISNCVIRSSASAVKLGTKSEGGFRNVTIENIHVYDTFRSAIAIESVDGGFLENILVDNVRAINTGNAIFIKLGHREVERKEGSLRNVTIKNMWVDVPLERPDYEYDIRGPALAFFHNTFPASITGMPGFKIENIILENININYPGRGNKGLAYAPLSRLNDVPENADKYPEFSMFGELPAWGFYIRHVDGIIFKNINLSIAHKDYRPPFVFDDVQNLNIESVNIYGDSKKDLFILYNTEKFDIDQKEGVIKM